MAEARGVAHARAALAGNPSDGHGGAVLAVTIPQLAATVTASAGAPDADEPEILRATRRRFLHEQGLRPSRSPRLRVQTTIPREVGLAGSSAIVIAALRALHAWHELPAPQPLQLARRALEVETEELGIAAGPQDRVVQAHGGLVFMDFAGGHWHAEPLDRALLPPLAVAWLPDGGTPSGAWHAALRARPAAEVQDAMARLAALARGARAALLAADHEAFAATLDATLAIRAELGPLDAEHRRLAQAARAGSCRANYTGSGGAIVAVVTGAADVDRMRARMPSCHALLVNGA